VTSGASYAFKNYVEASPKERSVLQAGQANVFFEVMETGLTFFDTNSAQDEQRVTEVNEMLDAVKAKADAAVEVLSTSWQDGDSDVADVSDFDQSLVGSP